MKVVIHGYYGAGNIGDDAILESIIDSIHNRNPKAKITVISRGIKAAYRGPYNVETVHVDSYQTVVKKVKNANIVILGGGGLLQDYNGWQAQNKTGLQAKGMNYYGQIVNLAKRYNKPTHIYAIGIGPLFTVGGREYAKSLLSKAKSITVRDIDSYRFVDKYLFNKSVLLTSDPALNLKAISARKARGYLKQEKVPLNKRLIGICLRPWMFKQNERERLLNRITKTARKLTDNNKNHLVLIPFSNYAGDTQIMRDLAKRLHPSTYTLLKRNYQAKALKGICGQLSLMIGMRLHALILSAGLGVPVIGLSYDPKINHFLRDLERSDCIFSYSSFNPNKLALKANKLLYMPSTHKEKFKNKVRLLKYKEKGNIQQIFQK